MVTNGDRIEQRYIITAPIERVWQAFVDPTWIERWGAGPAVMSDESGATFSLWGGDIFGSNTKVMKPARLEQNWYGDKEWPEPSRVYFTFADADNGQTVVELLHLKVPIDELDAIDRGWQDYYLGPIKRLLED